MLPNYNPFLLSDYRGYKLSQNLNNLLPPTVKFLAVKDSCEFYAPTLDQLKTRINEWERVMRLENILKLTRPRRGRD